MQQQCAVPASFAALRFAHRRRGDLFLSTDRFFHRGDAMRGFQMRYALTLVILPGFAVVAYTAAVLAQNFSRPVVDQSNTVLSSSINVMTLPMSGSRGSHPVSRGNSYKLICMWTLRTQTAALRS
jgi:hypothetical protein